MSNDTGCDAPNPERDHFSRLVQKWSHFGPPLRPSTEDTLAVQRAIDAVAATARPGHALRAVVLGLTPETIGCNWPLGTALTAVDHSPAMMRELWPPEKGPAGARAVLAGWLELPIETASIDFVAGDGGYIVFSHPEGYAALTREVHRVLRPGGVHVVRVFLRPDRAESVEDIRRDFSADKIGSVHALKLRLLAALHGASGAGTRLDDVWQAWGSFPQRPPHQHEPHGWTPAEIAGIENYRGLETRYFLPTLAEMRAVLSPYFEERHCHICGYEWAMQCPTFELVRRG